VDNTFTFEEILIGLRRIHDYIGEEKWSELMKGEVPPEFNKKLPGNEEILERIRNHHK